MITIIMIMITIMITINYIRVKFTVQRVSVFGVFLVRIFPHSDSTRTFLE